MKKFALLTLVALAFASLSVQAQVSNLLQNPGFESDQYVTMTSAPDGSAYYNVPGAWGGGVDTTLGAQPWLNVMPNGFPHEGGYALNGRRSFHVSRGGGTFTAWFYQTVATTPNTDLEGGAWGLIDKTGGGGAIRAGIDPSGGTNPFASTVIWGDWAYNPNAWNRVNVVTKAKSTSATLILFMTQSIPSDPNGVYWDDAYLNGVGGVSIVPAPPVSAPATSGQVVNATTTVNVRSGASTSASKIGKIYPGTLYNYVSTEGEWVIIDYNGQRGYVSAKFVGISNGTLSANTNGAVTSASGVTFTAQYSVNIRTTPNTTSARTGRLTRGQVAAVVAKSSDGQWVQLDTGGWVAVRFGQLSGNPDGLPLGGY